jgi:hypothetical protein
VKQDTGLPITTLAELIIAETAARYGNAEAKEYIRQYMNVNDEAHGRAKRLLNLRDKFKSWKRNHRIKSKPKEQSYEKDTDEQQPVSCPTRPGIDRDQAA